MKRKFSLKRVALAGAAFGAAAVAALAGVSANADPIPPSTYVALGSDTIQDLFDGYANGYTVGTTTVGQSTSSLASWDAFEPGVSATTTIRTKVGGPFFNRPSGSGAGVLALSASKHAPNTYASVADPSGLVNIANQVDIARSSSGPDSAHSRPSASGSDLTYIPIARDAVAVATKGVSTISNFTTAQLTAIFNCTADPAAGVTIVSGHPTVSGVSLNPKLPQSSSGTRQFFLGAIGLSAPGGCVSTTSSIPGSGANTLQENHANELTANGDIVPFSAAQWIAQQNGVVASTFTGTTGVQIKSVNSQAPVSGTAPSLTPGALYGSLSAAPTGGPVGVFDRDVYAVITSADVSGNTALFTLVNVTLPDALRSTGHFVVQDFGFGHLTYVRTTTTGRKYSTFTN